MASHLSDLLLEEDVPLDVVIGDNSDGAILTADGKAMIAGPTGLGKTNLILRLERCLCEGVPFLGFPILKPRRVLHLALEGSRSAMKRRLRKVWNGASKQCQDRLSYAFLQLNLADDSDIVRLNDLLSSSRPDVLVIDPLRNAHPWDENKSDEMALLTSILDGIIAHHGCSLMIAHHNRKRPAFVKADNAIDRVRGSTALTGWLSACLVMDPNVTEDRMTLTWAKTRDAEEALDPIVVDFNRDTIDFEVNAGAASKNKVSGEAILNAVLQHGDREIRGTELIAGFVQGAGASERWVRERIRKLVEDKRLEEFIPLEEGKGAKWYRIPDADEAFEEKP